MTRAADLFRTEAYKDNGNKGGGQEMKENQKMGGRCLKSCKEMGREGKGGGIRVIWRGKTGRRVSRGLIFARCVAVCVAECWFVWM